jgi:hypothetical protein
MVAIAMIEYVGGPRAMARKDLGIAGQTLKG